MKRIASFAAVLLIALPALAEIRGAWTITTNERNGRLQLNMTRGNSNQGQTFVLSDFTGLTSSHLNATTQTLVQFTLNREAGVISFDGVFKGGYGAGQFSFAPNRSYEAAIRALGVTGDTRKRGDGEIDDDDLFHLATHDVSTQFIRSMQAEGYRLSLQKYMAMRIFDVNPELVRELRALGFNDVDADDLIATRIHGATPQYIREMNAAGFTGMSLDEIVGTRIHGVTPSFIAEMTTLGYGSLDFDDYQAFRIHGVTPSFVNELASLGYKDIRAKDLVSMRIHGVTPKFIRELREAGYSNIPVRKLVEMKIHGVDGIFAKRMNGKK